MDGRQFIIEMTMGVYTVYLPSEAKWEQAAPDWAAEHWKRVKGDLTAWCEGQKMPLAIEDRAWVHFE